MKIESLRLVHAWDRDTGSKLLLNGYEILSVNYEEHGSGGPDLLEILASNLGRLADLRVQEDQVDDDEFDRLGADA